MNIFKSIQPLLSNQWKWRFLLSKQLHLKQFSAVASKPQVSILPLCNTRIPTSTSIFAFNQLRYYAKDKNIKKSTKGKKAVSEIDEEVLSEVLDLEEVRGKFQFVVDGMKDDFNKQLTLRTVGGSLESLVVNVEGDNYPLREVAQIVKKNPQLFIINLSSLPQYTKLVMEALQSSGLNLTPQQEGTTIFVPVPKVTKEHREMMAKNAKGLCVKCKDNIRDVQNKIIKDIRKKQGTVSEDVIFVSQQQIMGLAKQYSSDADNLLEVKQKELLGK